MRKCRTTHMPIFLTLVLHCWDWFIVFKKMSGKHFSIQGQYDLDLWPRNPKVNRGHLLVMNNHLVKYKNVLLKIIIKMSGNHFDIQCHCELVLLPLANLPMKYEDFVMNDFQYNQRKPYGLSTDRPSDDIPTDRH